MRKHVEVHLTPEKEKYHLLETAPTNATDQDKKGLHRKKEISAINLSLSKMQKIMCCLCSLGMWL